MSDHGNVASVTEVQLGDFLASAATAGDDFLVLEDAEGDFYEGGGAFLQIGDEVHTYTAVDFDTNTVSLDGTLSESYDVDEPVYVYPASKIRYAEVLVDTDTETSVRARVPLSLWTLLPVGTRNTPENGGESVVIELQRNEWVIVDVLGTDPTIDPTFIDGYVETVERIVFISQKEFTLESGGGADRSERGTFPDSYEAIRLHAGADEGMYIVLDFPSDYIPGTEISFVVVNTFSVSLLGPYVRWEQNTLVTADNLADTGTSDTTDQYTAASMDYIVRHDLPLTVSTETDEDVIRLTLTRLGGVDTFVGNALFIGVEMHYEAYPAIGGTTGPAGPPGAPGSGATGLVAYVEVGAGAAVTDGDFDSPPDNGTIAVAHDTSTGLSRFYVKINDVWKAVEVT